MQKFFGMGFRDAVQTLLGQSEIAREPVQNTRPVEKAQAPKKLILPLANENNNRVLAYLTKTRLLAPEIVQHFLQAGMLYESTEPYKDRTIHNLVIVGKDEKGTPRQAHIKGLSRGSSFRRNAQGSDPRYGFAHIGTSGRVHVFEAAIDLMSYLTLHPEDWQTDSYVALDGTAEHALLTVLDAHPQIQNVVLSLDHDPGGQLGAVRLQNLLLPRGLKIEVETTQEEKDWNEQLRHKAGLEYIPASEHPILQSMPQYAAALYDAIQGGRLSDAPIERLSLALHQYAAARRDGDAVLQGMALQKCAACAAVRALETLRQVHRGIDQSAFETRLCAAVGWIVPQKGENQYLADLERDVQQIRYQAEAQPTQTEEQKLAAAKAYLALAGKCIALQVAHDVVQPTLEPEEVHTCQMGFC